MLHARVDGETFGLSCAEFSIVNKPVMTYNGFERCYDRAHIEMNPKILLYNNSYDLYNILLSLNHDWIKNNGPSDMFSQKYNPNVVINQFKNKFIDYGNK